MRRRKLGVLGPLLFVFWVSYKSVTHIDIILQKEKEKQAGLQLLSNFEYDFFGNSQKLSHRVGAFAKNGDKRMDLAMDDKLNYAMQVAHQFPYVNFEARYNSNQEYAFDLISSFLEFPGRFKFLKPSLVFAKHSHGSNLKIHILGPCSNLFESQCEINLNQSKTSGQVPVNETPSYFRPQAIKSWLETLSVSDKLYFAFQRSPHERFFVEISDILRENKWRTTFFRNIVLSQKDSLMLQLEMDGKGRKISTKYGLVALNKVVLDFMDLRFVTQAAVRDRALFFASYVESHFNLGKFGKFDVRILKDENFLGQAKAKLNVNYENRVFVDQSD